MTDPVVTSTLHDAGISSTDFGSINKESSANNHNGDVEFSDITNVPAKVETSYVLFFQVCFYWHLIYYITFSRYYSRFL